MAFADVFEEAARAAGMEELYEPGGPGYTPPAGEEEPKPRPRIYPPTEELPRWRRVLRGALWLGGLGLAGTWIYRKVT